MITKIINSLNRLEVHGKQNLDILLGCIIALESIRQEELKKEMSQKESDSPVKEETDA